MHDAVMLDSPRRGRRVHGREPVHRRRRDAGHADHARRAAGDHAPDGARDRRRGGHRDRGARRLAGRAALLPTARSCAARAPASSRSAPSTGARSSSPTHPIIAPHPGRLQGAHACRRLPDGALHCRPMRFFVTVLALFALLAPQAAQAKAGASRRSPSATRSPTASRVTSATSSSPSPGSGSRPPARASSRSTASPAARSPRSRRRRAASSSRSRCACRAPATWSSWTAAASRRSDHPSSTTTATAPSAARCKAKLDPHDQLRRPAAGLRRGRRGAAQRRVRRLGVDLRRPLADRPRRQDPPRAGARRRRAARCTSSARASTPGGPLTVGDLPFAAPDGFLPGAGSLAVRGSDLYLSSTCQGGIQRLPISVLLDDEQARRRARGADHRRSRRAGQPAREPEGHHVQPLGPEATRGSTPATRSALKLIRVNSRTGKREVLSNDARLFNFTVATTFLPPTRHGGTNPLVTTSDQEYRWSADQRRAQRRRRLPAAVHHGRVLAEGLSPQVAQLIREERQVEQAQLDLVAALVAVAVEPHDQPGRGLQADLDRLARLGAMQDAPVDLDGGPRRCPRAG